MTGVIASTETALCRIFADVLGLELVRPDDAFFDVGGDSVLALQVVARAREAGLALSVRDLFDHQTPAELAAVPSDLAEPAAPVAAGGSGGSAPRADAAGGSGGSSPRADTAGGSGGSSPRADTAPLLTLTAEELDELADADIDQQVSGAQAGWEEAEWETVA